MDKSIFLGKLVYIMPMNHIGVFLYHALKREGVLISGILDNDDSKKGILYDNTMIMSPESIEKDSIVITCLVLNRNIMEKQLYDLGINNIIYFRDIINTIDRIDALEDIQEKRLNELGLIMGGVVNRTEALLRRHLPPPIHLTSNALNISALAMSITSACTLKCKDCSSCIQYYKKPMFVDLEDAITGLESLVLKVDYIGCLTLVGGETLLYKWLPELLKAIDKYDNIGGVSILANGTILPSLEVIEAVKSIKRYDCIFEVSDYGKLSRNIDNLETLLKEHGCKFTRKYIKGWFGNYWQIIDGESRSDEDVQRVYDICDLDGCSDLVIMGKKVFRCGFLAHASALRAIPFNSGDFIDICDPFIRKDDIRKYLHSKDAYPGCRNCSGCGDIMDIPFAIQTSEPLPYKEYKWD